jgi:hypothetical protein
MNTDKELTADDIFGLAVEVEELKIEQWGGRVYMRALSGSDRAKLQAKIKTKNVKNSEGNLDVMVWIIIYIICDSKGKRIFKDDKKVIENLKGLSGAILENIANEAMKYNGLSEPEKQIEKEAKNS